MINCIIPKGLRGTRGVRYSLYGSLPNDDGEGNIEGNPLFVDPAKGDYRLQVGSPCIDTGTKVETVIDLDGNPRPVDLVAREHEGDTSYDMGCYEFQLPEADLDANGDVNAQDLLLFQEQWHEGEGSGK